MASLSGDESRAASLTWRRVAQRSGIFKGIELPQPGRPQAARTALSFSMVAAHSMASAVSDRRFLNRVQSASVSGRWVGDGWCQKLRRRIGFIGFMGYFLLFTRVVSPPNNHARMQLGHSAKKPIKPINL